MLVSFTRTSIFFMQMTKIKAILDQETWVAVDVPEEFQAIVASFHFHEESLVNDASFQNSHNEQLSGMNASFSQGHLGCNGINENKSGDFKQILPVLSVSSIKENRLDSAPNRNADGNSVEAGRSASQTLVYGGVGYHMVNWLVFFMNEDAAPF